jgi:hypothetical protein
VKGDEFLVQPGVLCWPIVAVADVRGAAKVHLAALGVLAVMPGQGLAELL